MSCRRQCCYRGAIDLDGGHVGASVCERKRNAADASVQIDRALSVAYAGELRHPVIHRIGLRAIDLQKFANAKAQLNAGNSLDDAVVASENVDDSIMRNDRAIDSVIAHGDHTTYGWMLGNGVGEFTERRTSRAAAGRHQRHQHITHVVGAHDGIAKRSTSARFVIGHHRGYLGSATQPGGDFIDDRRHHPAPKRID